jgi:stage II sporulation protein AA (anti-sigma F factor antagonist)
MGGEVFSRILTGELAHRDGRVVYRLQGDLDMAVADAVRDRVGELVGSAGGGRVILDLSELRFIDSRGVRALLQLQQQAEAEGATLILFRPNPHVRKVLDLLELGAVFSIEP